jgi:hypothetical protein
MDTVIKIVAGVIVILAIGYFSSESVDRDATGQIVEEGNVDIFQLRIGDCLDDDAIVAMNESDAREVTEVSGVGGVPCGQSHDSEVFAQTEMGNSSYPGVDSITEYAMDYCIGGFPGYVGIDYDASLLEVLFFYPTQESWTQANDREISCVLVHMLGEKLTGSMKLSGI